MSFMSRPDSFRTAFLSLLLVSGCGSSDEGLGSVSGTVTLDGQPVSGAVIIFHPKADKGSPSYGGTDENGRYTLSFTKDRAGAMLGDHEVELEPSKLSKSELADLKAAGQPEPPPPIILPKKYKSPGGLTATVVKGSNTIDFPLDSK
jgi:hypothetical protein